MRSGIAIKLFTAAGLAMLLGLAVVSLLMQFFSGRVGSMLDDDIRDLSRLLVNENNTLFNHVAEEQIERFRLDQDARARRQVAAAAIYAMQPLQYGELDIFRRVCEKFIEFGDCVALYAVYEDGSFFSGAGRPSAPEVTRRIGDAAVNLRVDRMADLLTADGVAGVKQYEAPIIDLTGTTRGEVRLLVIDDIITEYRDEMNETGRKMQSNISELSKRQSEATHATMLGMWRRFWYFLWLAGAGTLFMACVGLYFAARYITRPLVAAVKMANAIRSDNMSTRIRVSDRGEAGQLILALNDMADRIRDREDETRRALHRLGRVLDQVALAAREITASASHLAASSQAVTNDAEHQENLMRAIESSITALGEGMRLSSENADKTASLTSAAMAAAKKGDKEMERMTQAMAELENSHKRVAGAMKVIDEIAFQTNLLALNAAVEAARAGRHGKGFAVVADEVRNLAAKSARAAKETEEMMQESLGRLSYAAECQGSTGRALTEIEESVTAVGELMREIVRVAGDNARGLTQVRENVEEVNQTAARNHMSASASAATAEELLAMAGGLRDMLRLGGEDKRRGGGGWEGESDRALPQAVENSGTQGRNSRT